MTRLEKRIRRLRQQPRGISGDDLGRILDSLGFLERKATGSHKCYTLSDLPGVILTAPKQKPLLPTYVKQALKAIERLIEPEDRD